MQQKKYFKIQSYKYALKANNFTHLFAPPYHKRPNNKNKDFLHFTPTLFFWIFFLFPLAYKLLPIYPSN